MSDRQLAGLVGGRYEITGLIATGGMGSVYRALDTVLERIVALKVMREGGDDPSFTARFKTEATNAARLSHPRIVQVFDFGYADGMAYMAMEYVDGQTLRDVLNTEGPLRPEQAARIAADVATALEHARRAGIVHRDVKPENILITTEGQVKVADFGLSRAFAAAQATMGKLYGTAHYLAPEQVRGMSVDHRTDVYSLGIVLYEMLTGRPPFDGDSPAAIAYRRVNEDVPSAMARNPSVPRELDAVILRATAREPDERYPNAGAMAADLGGPSRGARADEIGVLVHHTTAVPIDVEPTIAISRSKRATRKRRRRLWVLLLVLALLIPGSMLVASRLATVEVPNVVGETQQEARELLEARDLRVDIVLVNDARIARGIVVSQDPADGASVRPDTAVTINVSIGPEMVSPQDVRNTPFAAAEKRLRELGFDVRRIDEFHDTVKRLYVIEQSIQAGVLVERGSTITLTVSKGPERVRVPDVVGDPEANAIDDLERAGFEVKVERKNDSEVPEGLVISQTPDGGTDVIKGGTVTLVISKGPVMAKVPNLRCLRKEVARDKAAHEGFKITFEGDGERVVDQQPGPDQKAPKGSTITAQLGFGSFC